MPDKDLITSYILQDQYQSKQVSGLLGLVSSHHILFIQQINF